MAKGFGFRAGCVWKPSPALCTESGMVRGTITVVLRGHRDDNYSIGVLSIPSLPFKQG